VQIVTQSTHTVTRELATAASMLIRICRPVDQSLHRGLAKAEARLVELPWSVDGGVLCIASHSHPGQVHYTDGETCDCLTVRGVCWHRSAYVILSTIAATGAHPVATLPLPRVLDEDELPASFLDGDFDAFEDTALTAPSAVQPFRIKPARVLDNPLDADVDALFAA